MVSISKTHSLLATVAAGMRVKAGYQDIVEQAKAQVDDIVAEAEYLNNPVDVEVVEGGKAE